MNREIKFRGKRLSDGKWVYGNLRVSGEGVYISSIDCHAQCEVHLSTVGQYTGLKDKNGKEIYEGDIVRYLEANDEIATKEVRFIDAAFSPITEIMWMGDMECEVIGNIHEQGKEVKDGKHPKD